MKVQKIQYEFELKSDTSLTGCDIKTELNSIYLSVYCSNNLYKILLKLKNHPKKIIEILSKCTDSYSLGSFTGFNFIEFTLPTTTSTNELEKNKEL